MKKQLKGNKCSKEEAYLILKEFLLSQIELSQRKVIDENTFEIPNWALLQAYQAGVQKALTKVLEYIPDQAETK